VQHGALQLCGVASAVCLCGLSQVAGRRTVPVEVGSHYLAEGWGTRLMTLQDFIAAMTAPGKGHDCTATCGAETVGLRLGAGTCVGLRIGVGQGQVL